jgi:transcriptional regulator with XRE-family HTH domain
MCPLGPTLIAWRLHRGLTQAALAKVAGIPRPNLCAIERGDRDVTLRTLRALALALDARPGALVDGEGPPEGFETHAGRAALERVAAAATTWNSRSAAKHSEGPMAGILRDVLGSRRFLAAGKTAPAPSLRGDRAWLRLRIGAPAQVIDSLLGRSADRLARTRKTSR